MSFYVGEGSGGTVVELFPQSDPVEDAADAVILGVRKILRAYRAGEMDAENSIRMMRKNAIEAAKG